MHNEFERLVIETLSAIGADMVSLSERDLPVFEDAQDLEVAHVSASGREHLLTPDAASNWRAMHQAAAKESVEILVISGFRSFDKQLELINSRLQVGEPIGSVLRILAPPGCSEHHTGRAVDIGTPGCPPLSEDFEETKAFYWLEDNAAAFGFTISYPRNNVLGYAYEPWHWCYNGTDA